MRFLLPILLIWGSAVFAADFVNVQRDGGFETPVVTGRTQVDQGADPSNHGKGPGWILMQIQQTGSSGKVTAGLTNEVARTGKQSLWVRFDHVNGAYQSAVLISNFMPVTSGTDYQIGIWGRTDAKDMIDSKGRSAYLKLQVDYFARDANQSVGETFFAVQPLPGSKDHDPFFKPDGWKRFYLRVTTPPDAVFAQITWRWETGSDPGEINGIMYFDDAEMIGPEPPVPNMTPAPVQDETTTTGTAAQ